MIYTYLIKNIDWGEETISPLSHKILPTGNVSAIIKFSRSNAPSDYWDHLTAIADYIFDVFLYDAEQFEFTIVSKEESK